MTINYLNNYSVLKGDCQLVPCWWPFILQVKRLQGSSSTFFSLLLHTVHYEIIRISPKSWQYLLWKLNGNTTTSWNWPTLIYSCIHLTYGLNSHGFCYLDTREYFSLSTIAMVFILRLWLRKMHNTSWWMN